MRTRVAPTPSGYLHAGNAVNALLVSWLAGQHGGSVRLRIDDVDGPRYRPEYVDDLLDVLQWLGVEWDSGPRTTAEFESEFSLARRIDYFRRELGTAVDRGLPAFACTCTRSQALAAGRRGCVADCTDRHLALEPGLTALRVRATGLDDIVLWRRDDLPAYHLASLLEDRDDATTHVVRGEDLRESTAIQLALAPYFAAQRFAGAVFLHHPLVTAPDGTKLSKSQSRSGPLPRTAGSLDTILATARDLAGSLGVVAP